MYLIRNYGEKVKAHIWDGRDTLCKLLNNPEIDIKKFSTHSTTKNKSICHLCRLASGMTKKTKRKKSFYDCKTKEDFRDRLIDRATESELEFKRMLEKNNIQFEFQKIIAGYIVDFLVWRKLSPIIIEIDGGIHNIKSIKEKDIDREKNLEKLGYEIIRFSNEDAMDNILISESLSCLGLDKITKGYDDSDDVKLIDMLNSLDDSGLLDYLPDGTVQLKKIVLN